jgi:hypothetical protein
VRDEERIIRFRSASNFATNHFNFHLPHLHIVFAAFDANIVEVRREDVLEFLSADFLIKGVLCADFGYSI